MRKISVSLLSPGLKVGWPIYDRQGRILLNTGVTLTKGFIRRLKQIGIPAVYIDDGLLPDYQEEDVISMQTRIWATQHVKQFFSSSKAARKKPVIIAEEITKIVGRLLDEILTNKSAMVNFVDIRSYDEYTFGHSVNVCVLAILTGISLGYNKTKLFHLGVAALLHDIGKTSVPLSILNKPGALTDEEFAEIKKHSFYGYETIIKNPALSKLYALVALQHHERFNGRGYPQGLSGKEIHQFAGITGMVDVYDALTADRAYRKAYPAFEAYEMISGSGDYLFEFCLVKAFLENVAAYPTGILVRLSTGEIGIVLETKKGYSLYPKVRILFTSSNEPELARTEIFLAEQEGLYIVEVIEDYQILQATGQQNGIN